VPISLRKQLGTHIRDLRRAGSLTQAEISKRTGLTQSHWSQIENGHLKFQIDTLELIAQGLRVSLATIFEGIVLGDLPK
jgi:transcriptional regulator with XRE-family HTH domain